MSYNDKLKVKSFCDGVNVKVSKECVITYSIEHKLLKKIELDYSNYLYHIVKKHKEVNLKKILEVLNHPDYIFKPSRSRNNEYYFEKAIKEKTIRVVIVKKDKVKVVKTAYIVENEELFTRKHAYCSYDRRAAERARREEITRKKEDYRYFKEAFRVKK